MTTRNRIGKKDSIDVLKGKIAGQRDAKTRWRYNREAGSANLTLGMLELLKRMETQTELDITQK